MAQPGLHRAFSTEILCEVFEHLDLGRPQTELPIQRFHRRLSELALLRLSTTCRAFSGPALDVLWRRPPSILAVLSVLPTLHSDFAEEYYFTTEPNENEWERFQAYACRVTDLGFGRDRPQRITFGQERISSSVWLFLSRKTPAGQGLFPRLKRLELFEEAPVRDPGRSLLLSPTLREIRISTALRPGENPNIKFFPGIVPIVQEALRLVSKLYSLRVSFWGLAHLPNSTAIAASYADLSHLQTLGITNVNISLQLLQVLLSAPSLETLELVIEEIDEELENVDRPLTSGLLALRRLHLTGLPDQLALFVDLTAPPHVNALSLYITADDWNFDDDDDVDEPEFLQDLHRAISPLARSNAGSLMIAFLSSRTPPVRDITTVLQPALEIASLARVTVSGVGQPDETHFPVSDDALRTLADAWPHLRELAISCKKVQLPRVTITDPAAIDRPSLRALTHFAERCPELVRLVLPTLWFEALPRSPRMHDLVRPPRAPHGLRELKTEHTGPVGDHLVRAMAFAIDNLFPHLDVTDAHADTSGRLTEWGRVEHHLLMLRYGRTGTHRVPPKGDCGLAEVLMLDSGHV
ncbi:uncharacterized protein BXZ73DRAFT_55873 [Epithele typhae]|uniref:uncharacterized protein n=1 Tax=Epithele typhae TaxID=378194 RepID=UPI0020083D3C|nr:uncharacterized protein BXZ73DRAFT_55873 [Epithele typhae]KAH9912778.1 hypothetical protein BXZ73DRAFT_55873 [Epithele typhae]